jgi:hypothetical protein
MNGRGYGARVLLIDEDEAAVHVVLENNKGIKVTPEDCDLSDIEVGFLRVLEGQPHPVAPPCGVREVKQRFVGVREDS